MTLAQMQLFSGTYGMAMGCLGALALVGLLLLIIEFIAGRLDK